MSESEVFEWRDAPKADFAVIGDPISHSLSPKMHHGAYTTLGLSYRYVAIRVSAAEVGAALDHLRDLGYIGVNVTVPHKEAALEWCEDREPFAQKVRAANTVRLANKSCINTDAPGFLDTLADLGLKPLTALFLGAGGSARAIAHAMVGVGWRLRVFNRTRARAEEMIIGLGFDVKLMDSPDPEGCSLIVNTTSSSLQYADLQIPWNRASQTAFAYDLMYDKHKTAFLAKAAGRGLRTCDGLPLLIAQGARSLEWWLGPEIAEKDAEIRWGMREALR
jgi:shikimate dehydrogenase